MSLSIVDDKKINRDPRNMAYLNPSMSVITFKIRVDDYYKNICLKRIEDMARMNNQLVIPASCLNWSRKKKLQERNIRIFNKSYYILAIDELRPQELKNYEMYCDDISI